ncbi:hypothetical protein [Alicyclobacillus sp. ALC3]|uniref:hypothetical protein n=1 Tax=Alicyclobacillus sp. ALC3 TaxID=2796143 RepID=UPI002377D658|nr:hypothetical protein [Alicyclobacillus sp. ALC3]WDL96856.1 hypothetical protein JC200_21630 [Alicyclobacillus sp. ALC3]
MPAFILTGPISVSTPQQNAFGVSLGFNNQNNNDANMKFNAAQGGNFGIMSVNISAGEVMFDNLEYIDGVVNTNDVKNAPTGEF